MFKMRINFRKLTIIICIILFLWLIFTFSHLIQLPKTHSSSKNVVYIQNRIDQLEKQMYKEFNASEKLFNLLKEKVKKVKPVSFEKELDRESWAGSPNQVPDIVNPVLPVLVIACDRVTVRRCIENLIRFRPNKEIFPIIISQDCGHDETYKVIKSFVDEDPSISVIRQPDLTEIVLPKPMVKFRGYYKIARHFRFALNYILVKKSYDAVIIVEDDLDISPDFFEYFLGTYPLLKSDPSIWCISAWNDNGKKGLIDQSRPDLLHRTDFFPGLGWLLARDTWLQLEPNWPPAFFDDWLRNPKNTDGRSCIRPEISRTYSFGKVGVSKGLFFDMHLRYIQLNMEPVQFTKFNLSYLIKDNFDRHLESIIDSMPAISAEEVMSMAKTENGDPVKVHYSDAKSLQKAAKTLSLMDDFRSGIPRTAYRGIVTCFIRGRRVYLAPNFTWIKYDPSWG